MYVCIIDIRAVLYIVVLLSSGPLRAKQVTFVIHWLMYNKPRKSSVSLLQTNYPIYIVVRITENVILIINNFACFSTNNNEEYFFVEVSLLMLVM